MLGSCLHNDMKLYYILSCSEGSSVCGRGDFGFMYMVVSLIGFWAQF